MLNDHIKVPIILLIVGLSFSLCAQIPDNFEFLDHRVRSSYPGVILPQGDKIYYVSHNNVPPFTTVNVVDSDSNVETILSLNWLFSQSKVFNTSDTTAVIILDELIEYDIGFPGFYMIHIGQNKVETDSLFTDWEENYMEVSGAVVDSIGRAVFMSNDQIITLDSGTLINSGYTDKNVRLYHNQDHLLFGYDGRTIYKFDNDNFIARDTLEHYIVSVRSFGNENLILTRENLSEGAQYRLEIYNVDFSEKKRSQELPDLSIYPNSLDHINYDGNEIRLITSGDDQLEIISIDSTGTISTIHTDEAKDEQFYKLISLKEDRYLIQGVYGKNRFSKNIFFRNYSLSEDNNYDRVSVALNDFKLDRVYSDTTSIETYPGTKTFHFGRHDFEMELSIENQGSENVSIVNVYSIDNLDDFHPKFHLDYEYAGNISPSEIKTSYYKDSRYLDADILRGTVDIPFFIPGADFKFNEAPFWDFEVLVDIEELVEDSAFTIYPNPSNGFLNLSFDQALASIFIYDLNGVLVHSDLSLSSNDKIDVSNLPVGSYFIKATIKNQDQYIISKFIKI